MDTLTPEQRHKNMQRIRSKDTKIEVILRKALWARGIRYRKNYKGLVGTPEEALVWEIKEELDSEVSVGRFVDIIEYDYPDFHISMECYECSVVAGKLSLLEHENAKWLSAEELRSVEWLPADVSILGKIEELLK